MRPRKLTRSKLVLVFALLSPFAASAAHAATSEFQILLNLDVNPTTGCDVPTPDGTFQGVEQILVTTVETTGAAVASVTRIERRECTDPATDTFGAPILVDDTDRPVGVGLGASGTHVIETYFPLGLAPARPPVVRIGVLSSDGSGQDALLVRQPQLVGAPIDLTLSHLLEIPTASEWGLLLLALLLSAAALTQLRRREARGFLALLVVLGFGGLAWAATCDLDGTTTTEWTAGDRVAQDPLGDGPAGADIVDFYAMGDDALNRICFRIDATQVFNQIPTADDQALNTPEDTPLAVTLTGSDPDAGQTLTFSYSQPANGTVTGTAPNVTYTPNVDFSGVDSFTFQVNDGNGGADTGTITITVTPENDAPVVDPATFPVAESAALGTAVGTVTFTDPDAGQSHTFAITAGNTGGAFAIDATTGQITVAAALDFETLNSYALTVEVTDDGAPVLSGSATITINVTDADDAPAAVDDAATVAEDDPATAIDVLANDTDVDGGPKAIASASDPANGTVTPTGGTPGAHTGLTYEPDPDYCNDPPGTSLDTFTYTLTPGGSTATVSVTVTCEDDDPVAVADAATVTEDSGANAIDVLANDTDVDGGPISVTSVTQPAGGSVAITGGGTGLTYAPNANYCNTPPGTTLDTFTYTLTPGGSSTTVTVTVTCADDSPTAVADAATVAEDSGANTIDVQANDTDVDGGTNTITGVTQPANGAVAITNGGADLAYTPNANYCNSVSGVPDTFTYTLTPGGSSTTVTVTVTCNDDNPVAVADAATVGEDSGPNAINVLANDVDLDAGPISVQAVTQPANGAVAITNGGADVSYTPGANYCNNPPGTTPDTFTYTLNGGSSATVTVSVTCVNDGPVIDLDANDDKGTGGNDFAVTFTEGDAATLIEDGIDATVTDIDSATLATLTVTITNLLDTGNETLSADVTGTSVTANYVAATGVLTLTGPDTLANFETVLRTVRYHNASNAPDATARIVHFVANDGSTDGNTAVSTVTVVPVDTNPTAVDDSATVAEDSGANAIDVLANDTDPDGGAISVTSVTQPVNGAVAITNGGADLTYTPNANYCNNPPGTFDTFTYTLTPGGSSATVSVTVTCADDNPTAVADATTVTEDSGANAIDVLANDTDPDGGPISITSVTQGSSGSVAITGGGTGVTYTPNANYCNDGTPVDTFTYTLSPGNSSTTVSVTVTCVDDDPVAVADAATVVEDSGANAIDVLANDTDADGGAISITSVTPAANGVVAITGGGTGVTYTPNANYCNTPPGTTLDTFTYTLTPGGSSTTVTVTVTCVDDPPTAVADAATVDEDSGANAIDVQANDTDVDGGTNTITVVTQPTNGVVAITNGGADLTYTPNLNFCNNPPGSTPETFQYTLSPGDTVATVSVLVNCINDPPVAGTDTFETFGNTELRVDLAAAGTRPHVPIDLVGNPGVMNNDSDPVEGSSVSFTGVVGCADLTAPFDCPTANGGQVIVEADGSFSYRPPQADPAVLASTAADSFQYNIVDAEGAPATGTVNLTRREVIWYIDPAAAPGGDGRSHAPYQSFASLNGVGGAGDFDNADDFILVHAGTLSSSIELEAGQRLIGEGVGLSLPLGVLGTFELLAAGTHPQVNNAGDVVKVTSAIPARIAGLSFSGGVNAIDLTSAAALTGSATLAIENNQFRGAGAEGIDVNLNAGTTGTLALNVTGNAWDLAGAHAGNAVDVNRTAGAVNLNFSGNTNLVSSGGSGVVIASNALGGVNVTGFSGNTVSGNTAGAGVAMSQVTFDADTGVAGFQQIDGDNLAIGDAGNTVGGAGLSLSTVQGNLFFDNLGVYAGASGLTLSGSGGGMTFAVAPAPPGGSGTSVIRASNGAAVDVASATIDLRLDDMDSTTTGAGVSLSGVGGLFSTDTDASISKTSGGGTAFVVSNSVSGTTVAYAGTMNVTSGAGVALTNNGGSTLSFTGGMTLSTGTNAGFSATGGGTVTVTDPAGLANNTIATSSGTALNVTGTNIGAGGLTFERISAGSGGTPVNGIVLNGTGSLGGLTVTGNGNTSLGGNDSGGIIQNTSSDAISVAAARNISLTNMRIQNVGGGVGARGIEAVNLSGSNYFRYGTITGLGSGGGADRNGIDIRNTDTNMTLFSIESSVFSNSDSGTSFILSSARGTSTMRLDVLSNDFSDLVALAVQSNAGDTENAAHTVTTNITGNTFRNASPADGQGGVAVAVADQSATHIFTISNNTLYDLIKGIAGGNSEIVLAQTTGGALVGTISGNTIGNATAGNGDRRGIGVIAEPDVSINGEVGSVDVIIENNTIDRLPNREAIFVDLREDTQNSEIIVRNNLIGLLTGYEGLVGGDPAKAGAQREVIDIQSRGEVTRTLNLLVSGNNVRANTSVSVVNLEVNIDNSTPGNLTTHATVTGNTVKNDDPAGGAELLARPRDAGSVTTLCLDMSGNTLDGGSGQIELNETGVLNVEQASQAGLASANGIASGNVLVTGGAPSYGVACQAPPS